MTHNNSSKDSLPNEYREFISVVIEVAKPVAQFSPPKSTTDPGMNDIVFDQVRLRNLSSQFYECSSIPWVKVHVMDDINK